MSVEDEVFIGEVGKTKKHAEMNAAKVAYNILKDRKYLLFDNNFQLSVDQLYFGSINYFIFVYAYFCISIKK